MHIGKLNNKPENTWELPYPPSPPPPIHCTSMSCFHGQPSSSRATRNCQISLPPARYKPPTSTTIPLHGRRPFLGSLGQNSTRNSLPLSWSGNSLQKLNLRWNAGGCRGGGRPMMKEVWGEGRRGLACCQGLFHPLLAEWNRGKNCNIWTARINAGSHFTLLTQESGAKGERIGQGIWDAGGLGGVGRGWGWVIWKGIQWTNFQSSDYWKHKLKNVDTDKAEDPGPACKQAVTAKAACMYLPERLIIV